MARRLFLIIVSVIMICGCNPGDPCGPGQIFDCSYDCIDGFEINSVIGDGECNGNENSDTCMEDCGGVFIYCGDGECNGDEDSSTCKQDCGSAAIFCGDGVCNGVEDSSTCQKDCPGILTNCGDGLCDLNTESPSSCPEDCGTAVCGNGKCETEKGETARSCSRDCITIDDYTCGNGVCETSLLESYDNCPKDSG